MNEKETMALLELPTKVALLANDSAEMKQSLREMAASMNRLVLVEERQANTADALKRVFTLLDNFNSEKKTMSDKISALEMGQPIAKQQQGWIEKGMIFCVGALAMFALKKMGIML